MKGGGANGSGVIFLPMIHWMLARWSSHPSAHLTFFQGGEKFQRDRLKGLGSELTLLPAVALLERSPDAIPLSGRLEAERPLESVLFL